MHIDYFDKLRSSGFPIHGAIDRFCGKIPWLKVTKSNNSPENIAQMYLNSVKNLSGCARELVTDLGTENGIVEAIQSSFVDNADLQRHAPSQHSSFSSKAVGKMIARAKTKKHLPRQCVGNFFVNVIKQIFVFALAIPSAIFGSYFCYVVLFNEPL